LSTYTIYATGTCHWCNAAQNLLTQQGKDYEVKYVDKDNSVREELEALRPGTRTVPQIFLNEGDGFFQYIGGHDDLVKSLIGK
jgi:glutaredoxin 3